MSLIIYKNSTFDSKLPLFNHYGTLFLSTQNRRYRTPLEGTVVQCGSDAQAIFDAALEGFYADIIVVDLFDEWAKAMPERIGRFLDDYDDGLYEDTQLVLVVEDESLIEYWELEDVERRF